jgi:hypothetical protein
MKKVPYKNEMPRLPIELHRTNHFLIDIKNIHGQVEVIVATPDIQIMY